MGTDPTVDVDALLNPIDGNDPCGELSRFDPVFDEIRKARTEESRDAFQGGAVPADWRLVITRTSEILQHRAKDLMIAAYLAEALTEAEGFAGFRDGLRVITGLLERFWDGVFPRIEEGDFERRLAPLRWMTDGERGSRLPNRLREHPIVPALDGGRGLSLEFSQSTYASPKGESENDTIYQQRRAEAEQRAKILQDAVAAAPVAVFAAQRMDLEECLAEVARFHQVLDAHFGVNGPNLTPLREALADCSLLVNKLFKEKGGSVAESKPLDDAEPEQKVDFPERVITGPIRSREDALKRLTEVSAFFRQTEPHSPIPYLIERAVTWGGLTLEQLLQELIKDSGTRDQISDLLGMKRG